jgi:hypothetical protein
MQISLILLKNFEIIIYFLDNFIDFQGCAAIYKQRRGKDVVRFRGCARLNNIVKLGQRSIRHAKSA